MYLDFPFLLSENNECHLRKWEEFKKRNTLRKMKVAFNDVQISKEELKDISSEQLQNVASKHDHDENQFKIELPEIPCEFPDMAKKEAKIYPLPISHENQCTTLGVASNLDLFQDEFQFDSKKENQYLPLKSSRKDFNLELAYKRFAFLRTLEQHKKKQQAYEHFLRGQTADAESNSETVEEIDEVIQIVSQDNDSDSDTLSD